LGRPSSFKSSCLVVLDGTVPYSKTRPSSTIEEAELNGTGEAERRRIR
jgi:hypothetical protein